uniref:Ig-like domain-containing protein n=1 Tax=Xenopus tropicalis TaxID=8364 RepID=A0A6I8QMT1_XENTR
MLVSKLIYIYNLCKQGDPFQINCTYTGTENSLQWYRQTRDQPPQALLLLFGTGYKSENSFTMFLDTKSKFTFLYKNTSQTEDSASGTYLCALSDTAVQPNALSVQYVDEIQ